MIILLCKKCGVEKGEAEFRQDARYARGYASWCAQCHRDRNSSWAKQNRARLNEKAVVWRSKNIEKSRVSNIKCKTANKARYYDTYCEWLAANRDKKRAIDARRRTAKMLAMCSWADNSAIAAIYESAIRLEQESGRAVHVDHVIPLQNKYVCGLHHEANLQILFMEDNVSKKNKFDPFVINYSPPLSIEDALKRPDLFIPAPAPKAKQEQLI